MKKKTKEVVIKDKSSLVKHIIRYYYDKEKDIISPIKLQKSLYFLFAIWGGYILSIQQNKTKDKYYSSLSEYLFNDDFSVWTYGPVDEKEYHWFNKKFKDKDVELFALLSDEYQDVVPFINQVLNKLFTISDFGLVNLSHQDKVWKKAKEKNAKKILGKDIIHEYKKRLSN